MITNDAKEQNLEETLIQSKDLVGQVDLTQLPTIINQQVQKIKEISAKIDIAVASADDAKNAATKADNMPIGLFQKKKAIEGLQASRKKQAEAIGEVVEALKLSFEYEKQLGEISKFLLALGVYSAAHTEQIVSQLKAEIINKGTGSNLNAVAKKQLMQVISQLEAQGETIRRQEALEQKVVVQQNAIEVLEKQSCEKNEKISELYDKLNALNRPAKMNGLTIATLVFAVVALILSILNFII